MKMILNSKYFFTIILLLLNSNVFAKVIRDTIIVNFDTTIICSAYAKAGYLRDVYSKKSGKFHGKFTSWYKNGNIKSISTYKNGKSIDTSFSYYESGKIESICPYNGVNIVLFENCDTSGIGYLKNGRHIGEYKSWWKKGTLKSITRYNSSGQKHGLCETWYENGNRKDSVVYDNGKIVEARYYFRNGKLRYTAKWHDSLKIEMVTFYPDGRKCSELKSGTGEIKLFIEDGTKSYQYKYKDGRRID